MNTLDIFAIVFIAVFFFAVFLLVMKIPKTPKKNETSAKVRYMQSLIYSNENEVIF